MKKGKVIKKRNTENQFTLIELLVVISIIVILISMLMPSLIKARLSAKGIGCVSNLKQLGVGFSMYSNDSDGYIPAACELGSIGYGGGTRAGTSWDENIYTYVTNRKRTWALDAQPYNIKMDVLRCPLDVNKPWTDSPTHIMQRRSYVMNVGYSVNFTDFTRAIRYNRISTNKTWGISKERIVILADGYSNNNPGDDGNCNMTMGISSSWANYGGFKVLPGDPGRTAYGHPDMKKGTLKFDGSAELMIGPLFISPAEGFRKFFDYTRP